MDELTSAQLSEWEAFDRIDPIDISWRNDFMLAKMMALLQNIANAIYGKKSETPKLLSPIDMMPDWTGERKEDAQKKQSVEEMKRILLSIASAQNKKVERENIKTPPPKNADKKKKPIPVKTIKK